MAKDPSARSVASFDAPPGRLYAAAMLIPALAMASTVLATMSSHGGGLRSPERPTAPLRAGYQTFDFLWQAWTEKGDGGQSLESAKELAPRIDLSDDEKRVELVKWEAKTTLENTLTPILALKILASTQSGQETKGPAFTFWCAERLIELRDLDPYTDHSLVRVSFPDLGITVEDLAEKIGDWFQETRERIHGGFSILAEEGVFRSPDQYREFGGEETTPEGVAQDLAERVRILSVLGNAEDREIRWMKEWIAQVLVWKVLVDELEPMVLK